MQVAFNGVDPQPILGYLIYPMNIPNIHWLNTFRGFKHTRGGQHFSWTMVC